MNSDHGSRPWPADRYGHLIQRPSGAEYQVEDGTVVFTNHEWRKACLFQAIPSIVAFSILTWAFVIDPVVTPDVVGLLIWGITSVPVIVWPFARMSQMLRYVWEIQVDGRMNEIKVLLREWGRERMLGRWTMDEAAIVQRPYRARNIVLLSGLRGHGQCVSLELPGLPPFVLFTIHHRSSESEEENEVQRVWRSLPAPLQMPIRRQDECLVVWNGVTD